MTDVAVDPELADALLVFPDDFDPAGGLENPAVVAMLRDTRVLAGVDGFPTDDRVVTADRVVPGPDGTDLRLRLYTPADREGPSPACVFFHGGAFIIGDPEAEERRCLAYAADAGCVVVSADYRLAPEHRFPAGFDDAYAALVWTAGHVDELGVDPARIAVGGNSAGGALAAAVAQAVRDRRGPPVDRQLLIYPVLDDRMTTPSMQAFTATPIWTSSASAQMWRVYLGDEPAAVSPYAAPARADDLHGLPRAYVLTCQLDPLRDEGLDYARRLMLAGVDTELHHFAGAIHGFDSLAPRATVTARAFADQVAFLSR